MGVAGTLPELSEWTLSVNSKPDHPSLGDPRDPHILIALGVGLSPICHCQGGWEFESEKYSTVFFRKVRFTSLPQSLKF